MPLIVSTLALVGRDEADRVAWRGDDEVRLEHHRPLCALVEHVDLDFGRRGSACEYDRRAEGERCNDAFHGIVLSLSGLVCRWQTDTPRCLATVCARTKSG
jgi:hypothetical protein